MIILWFSSMISLITFQPSLLEPVSYGSYLGGDRVYVVSITEKMLEASPEWKKGTDNPPLSAQKAIEHADKKKATLVKDGKDFQWRLESASLIPAGKGRWYWLVKYSQIVRGGGLSGSPRTLRLVVLMNGMVIEPKKE